MTFYFEAGYGYKPEFVQSDKHNKEQAEVERAEFRNTRDCNKVARQKVQTADDTNWDRCSTAGRGIKA